MHTEQSIQTYLLCCHMYFCTHLGVLCNDQCPDKLLLGQLTSNNWHIGVKIFIVVMVLSISSICVIFKLMFDIWLYQMEKKLKEYLQSLYKAESPRHAILQVRTSITNIIKYL